jgi:hypothetical protein
MSDFEDIQRLIRLKRHERPPAEFIDQFLSAFQDRQRSEMLRNSARGLLWERVSTYFDGMLNPKWAWTGATAVAVLGLGLMLRPASNSTGQFAQSQPAAIGVNARDLQAVSLRTKEGEAAWNADVKQYLMSQHYGGGFGDEKLYTDTVTGQFYPAGFNVDLMESGQRR